MRIAVSGVFSSCVTLETNCDRSSASRRLPLHVTLHKISRQQRESERQNHREREKDLPEAGPASIQRRQDDSQAGKGIAEANSGVLFPRQADRLG